MTSIYQTALAASAFALIGGCSQGGVNKVSSCNEQCEMMATGKGPGAMGPPFPHGDNPTFHHVPVPFAPQYYAVVYLKLDNARLIARHAYFAGTSPNDKDLTCAINGLHDEKFATGSECKPIEYKKPSDLNDITSKSCPNIGEIFKDFDCFLFGNQSEIFVYIDDDQIDFYGKVPISFTHAPADADFGADITPTLQNSANIQDFNKSFYGAVVKTRNINGKGRSVLSLKNYFVDRNYQPITKKEQNQKYSINFNLRICRYNSTCSALDLQDLAKTIPMIIDPGSGNGLGYPP